MPLTDRSVRNAKAGVHADQGGLYLRVHPTGRKVFVVRDRRQGKDRWNTLGEYPAMGLAEARRRALEIKSSGPCSPLTVQDAFDKFYKHLSNHYRRPEQVKRRFVVNVLPALGKKQIQKVSRSEVSSLLQAIVDRGAPVEANRTLADVKHLWAYALEKGWIETNPLTPLTRKAVGGKEASRDRTLSWDELEAFLVLLKQEWRNPGRTMAPATILSLYLCLLTGQRASEVLSFRLAPGGALDGDGKTSPYKVPLTPHVRAAVKLLSRYPRPKDHRVLSHALRRRAQTFTPHDLRRTFSTRLSDLGVMPHVIEKMLNHKMVGVMAVYNQAEYWPERRAAQLLWGRKLAELRRKKRPD